MARLGNPSSDDFVSGAQPLGTLRRNRTLTRRGSLGISGRQFDLDDFYSFRLGARSRVTINLTDIQADVSLRILRQRPSGGERVIATSNRRGVTRERLSRNLNEGNYFIKVSQEDRDTRYTLRVQSGEPTDPVDPVDPVDPDPPTVNEFPNLITPADPGSLPATAFEDTRTISPRSFRNTLGGDDTADFYRFTVARSSRVRIATGGLEGGTVSTSLVYDVNGNGLADSSDILATGNTITKSLGAGTYFIGVTPATLNEGAEVVTYNIRLNQDAISGIRAGADPPLGLGDAADLGVLSGSLSFRQIVGVSDTNNPNLVGTFESTDIYKFTLTSEASNFSALLNTAQLTGDVTMSLIFDENGNGIANPGEIRDGGVILGDFPGGVFTEGGAGGAALAINKTLGAGTYFLAVTQRDEVADNTPYNIDLFVNNAITGLSNIGDPNNTGISTAFNVGVLNRNVTFKQFVGTVDPVDSYTFTIDRPRNIIIRYNGSSELAGIRFGRDYNGDGVLGVGEDLNNNRLLDRGEDLNGNGILDILNEDVNRDGELNPGEDVNNNGRLDLSEDTNRNGFLDPAEDTVLGSSSPAFLNGKLDREVFVPDLVGDGTNVTYSPLPPFFDQDAAFSNEFDRFLTPGIATDIYARLPAGTYVVQVNRETIETDLGDGLTRYGSANILYNLSFLLDG